MKVSEESIGKMLNKLCPDCHGSGMRGTHTDEEGACHPGVRCRHNRMAPIKRAITRLVIDIRAADSPFPFVPTKRR